MRSLVLSSLEPACVTANQRKEREESDEMWALMTSAIGRTMGGIGETVSKAAVENR